MGESRDISQWKNNLFPSWKQIMQSSQACKHFTYTPTTYLGPGEGEYVLYLSDISNHWDLKSSLPQEKAEEKGAVEWCITTHSGSKSWTDRPRISEGPAFFLSPDLQNSQPKVPGIKSHHFCSYQKCNGWAKPLSISIFFLWFWMSYLPS